MDYERIHKPLSHQTAGFSPKKLRAMLMGVEKRDKEEDEAEYKSSLRSEVPEFDDGRASAVDSFKDVECFTSIETPMSTRSRDYTMSGSRTRSLEEDSFDSESGSSGFEFQKAERGAAQHRVPAATGASAFLPAFSKPAPSKWDDAQKWIASPNSSRGGSRQGRKSGHGHWGRQGVTRVVMEVVDDVDTKRIDGNQVKKDDGDAKTVNWVEASCPGFDSAAKMTFMMEKPVASDSAVSLSQHESSAFSQTTTTFVTPAQTVRAVSMRDMGTEMTPIASQEPSRTGTPVRATSPLRSPTSSLPSSPKRATPDAAPTKPAAFPEDFNNTELSEKELQKKTRREIMVLGQQLGKTNIAAWASKEEANSFESCKALSHDESLKNILQARAAAWEDAEKAKYLARFKQEEIKIQAWENHQKAKTEAEMRKIEVKVEKVRACAQEKLMNQLAVARHRAEEMRAAAEAKRNQQAAKTAQQAEYIRRTGRIPSSFSCWGWCF